MNFLKNMVDNLENSLLMRILRKKVISNFIFAGVFFIIVFEIGRASCRERL